MLRQSLGISLTGKSCQIIVTKSGDFQEDTEQDELIAWIVEKADEFTKVFKKLL